MHVIVTALQLVIGQASVLAAKYQRHFRALLDLFHTRTAALARIKHRPGNVPIAGTGTQHQAATDECLFQRGHHLGVLQNIVRPGGARHGLGAGKLFGIDQNQSGDTHILHGSSSPTDIAWMTGIDQHHAHVL